ncbi:ROK family protein [Fictibacillus sp. KIGAM418]|uniref:ROK family protein n=1 Tax=Fictibacillus marinisediminis TaxID=2878389 RepID=A0A9X2BGW9_9BACL|nr:ROK family protein [Fictibacillus marinisediminis]MCK6258687.1 ROK family protein [Fictibacillus marinisediminis]
MGDKYYLTTDIGGTNVEAALFEADGTMLANREFPTQEFVDSGVLIELAKQAKEMAEEKNVSWEDIVSAGIVAPGVIDPDKGVVFHAPNLKWQDYELKKEAEEMLGVPVHIDNDVNGGLLGEVYYGAAQGKKNVLLFMIGTSIGAGLLINGEIYRGAHWASGEVGHMISDPEAAMGSFIPIKDGYGFLSSKMGGVAIAHHYREAKRLDGEVSGEELNRLKASDVFRFAEEGDKLAQGIIREGILHMGMAIVNAAALINPETIVIGGGVAQSGNWFLGKIKSMLEEFVPCPTEVVLAGLKDQSPLYGALALCQLMDKEEKVQEGNG